MTTKLHRTSAIILLIVKAHGLVEVPDFLIKRKPNWANGWDVER